MQLKSFSSANFNAYSMSLHRRVLPNTYCIALSYSCAYFSLCTSGRAFCLNTQRKCSTSLESTPWTQQGNIKNKWAWLLQCGFLNLNPVTAVNIVHINENIMLPNIHWYSHKHKTVKFSQTAITVHKFCYFVLLVHNISNEVQSYRNNSLTVVQVLVFH